MKNISLPEKWREGQLASLLKTQGIKGLTIKTQGEYRQAERFEINKGDLPLIVWALDAYRNRAQNKVKIARIDTLLAKITEPIEKLSQVVKSVGPLSDRGFISTKLNAYDTKAFINLAREYIKLKRCRFAEIISTV